MRPQSKMNKEYVFKQLDAQKSFEYNPSLDEWCIEYIRERMPQIMPIKLFREIHYLEIGPKLLAAYYKINCDSILALIPRLQKDGDRAITSRIFRFLHVHYDLYKPDLNTLDRQLFEVYRVQLDEKYAATILNGQGPVL